MIELKSATKYFRTGFLGIKKNAVENLSFNIEKGKVTGFFGPNGAGKSTTIKMIVGLIRPSFGTVKIDGYDASDHRARSSLGYLPENPSFPRGLKGMEIISYYANLLDKPVGRDEIDDALKIAGIFHAKGLHAHKYSKGMAQRLALAVSMLGDPEIFIFDEPLSGLDPVGRKEFKDIIFRLKERNKTIFFSSHVLADSKELCDRIAVLVNGSLVKCEDISAMEKEAEAYAAEKEKEKSAGVPTGTKDGDGNQYSSHTAEYSTPLEVFLYDLMLKRGKK